MQRIIYKPILYLRKDKLCKDGTMPIYVRFQRINGREPKFPFGISVAEDNWDEVIKRPKEPAMKIIVDKKVIKIEQEILNAIANDTEITNDLLREFVKGKERPELRSFYDYFDEYISKKLRRGRLSESTVAGYRVTYNTLKSYRSEINISDISTKFLEGFEKFMIRRGQEKGKGDVKGSRSNRLKHINAVLRHIEKQGVKVDNPYARGDLEVPQADKNDIFLEFDEVSKLCGLLPKLKVGEPQYRVLCMYLFSCATGLRKGNALHLKWGDIFKDDYHNKIIVTTVAEKGGKPLHIVIPELGIFALYHTIQYNPSRPENKVFDCAETNIDSPLRAVMIKAGIEKNATFHSSRRTFATLAKAMGIDDYILQNTLGHETFKMTQRYMKWSEDLALEMSKNNDMFRIKSFVVNKSEIG